MTQARIPASCPLMSLKSAISFCTLLSLAESGKPIQIFFIWFCEIQGFLTSIVLLPFNFSSKLFKDGFLIKKGYRIFIHSRIDDKAMIFNFLQCKASFSSSFPTNTPSNPASSMARVMGSTPGICLISPSNPSSPRKA